MRGLPGSGKTHLAKLIKDKEVEMGGSAPRILSIDDYFTTETDEIITCPTTGKDINTKTMVYEYEKEMEEQYLQYLFKSYKKTVSDGYFDFIIVDAVYPRMKNVREIASHAKSNGFVSYICSLEDVTVEQCVERNAHNRTAEELEELSRIWEPCPKSELRIDIRPLIEWSQITEIPVEDISNDEFEDDEEEKEKSGPVGETVPNEEGKESVKESEVKDDQPKVEAVTVEGEAEILPEALTEEVQGEDVKEDEVPPVDGDVAKEDREVENEEGDKDPETEVPNSNTEIEGNEVEPSSDEVVAASVPAPVVEEKEVR